MSLSEETAIKVDFAIDVIRTIGEHIRTTTNVRDELIPDMANTIFLFLHR